VFAGDGTDVDECKGGLGPCGSAEVAKSCNNIPSSYTCDCQDGYEFTNGLCRGISHNCVISHHRRRRRGDREDRPPSFKFG